MRPFAARCVSVGVLRFEFLFLDLTTCLGADRSLEAALEAVHREGQEHAAGRLGGRELAHAALDARQVAEPGAQAARDLPLTEQRVAGQQAVRAWLQLARTCDCETVDVSGLFTDLVLAPPPVRRPHTAA